MYSDNSFCVGFASQISSGGLSKKSSSSSGSFTLIADSGATDSMSCYGKEVYISYKRIQGGYVVLANKQKVPCLGIGKIRILMNGHPVIIDQVLHVPDLRKMLYSIRQHRRSPGCSFHADNDGIRLDFPTFSITVDDSVDCLVPCSFDPLVTRSYKPELQHVGSTSAVSDNTRHRNSRRGLVTQTPPLPVFTDSSLDEESLVTTDDKMEDSVLLEFPKFNIPQVPLQHDESIIVEDVSDDEDSLSVSLLNEDAEDLFPPDKSFVELPTNTPVSPGGSTDTSIPYSSDDDSDDTYDDDELELDLDLENLTGAELLAHLASLTDTPSTASLQQSKLSEKQIQEIAEACIIELQKHGCITQNLISFLQEVYSPASDSTRPVIPSDRPEMLSCDKPNSAEPAVKRLTYEQLCKYIGFRSFSNPGILKDIALDTVKVIQTTTKTLELGDVANIKKSRRNKIPIRRPRNFLDVVHMDIGFGDCTAVGGAKYCLLFVDRATRKHNLYALRSLSHTDIIDACEQYVTDMGNVPRRVLTDFDNKILEGPTATWFRENRIVLQAAPPRRQNQNGLVERAWETACNMARSYITDMRMPREYWYWALRHSFQVMDYLPVTVNGLSTTPFELVYGVKPDYRVLFRLFSTGFFRHPKDGTRTRSGIAEAQTLQGIAIGRCRQSDGLLFYCPHTREIYSSGDYKLDEGLSTPNLFNLRYDGGIFIGLYNAKDKTQGHEPYPQGTPVVYNTTINSKKVKMRGSVISVPIPSSDQSIPENANSESPYKIRLVDGTIIAVPPCTMDSIVDVTSSTSKQTYTIPKWLQAQQRVMFLRDGQYFKGIMEFNLDSKSWQVAHRRRNGDEIWSMLLPNFLQDFQKYIDDGLIIPGWHQNSNFIRGFASHVCAMGLHSPYPPGSLKRALDPRSPDAETWFDSYKEEFDGLLSNDTMEFMSEEEYHRWCRLSGRRAIPSMAVFTIKKDSLGRPLRAKSRIVVLGNRDPVAWSKADCYAPVASLPIVRLLTALAVNHKRTVKQGDCKNAFVQAELPPEEETVVKPPPGCPFSPPGSYWRLKKSLYGLRRAPRHWYQLITTILESKDIGLTRCRNDSCLFTGVLLPGKAPLYLILYVDDFLYFSPDDAVEKHFELSLAKKIKVDFMGDAEFFLGIKFDWVFSSDGHLDCRLSQEAYSQLIVDAMGLSDCSVSPKMTPFRSGYPIDMIPCKEMSIETRAPLITRLRCWCGMLNWLSLGTRPDITTVCSLLASCQCCPSPGHLEAAKYVGRYLKATAGLGLLYTSRSNTQLEGFVYFPTPNRNPSGSELSLLAFADANWGPQDASKPSLTETREISLDETKSITGHILFYGGSPVFWSSQKENRTSGSSCEAEIKATNGCTKSILWFRHVLSDLNLLPSSSPTPLYNDNQGAVNWSKTTSTKGMRHVNIQENIVRESIHVFKDIAVSHIPGPCNPSDIFTKEFKSDETFRQVRDVLLSYPSG
jgi:hypothetical protein